MARSFPDVPPPASISALAQRENSSRAGLSASPALLAQLGDFFEALFLQVLLELRGLDRDRRVEAAVAHDLEARRLHADDTGRLAAGAARDVALGPGRRNENEALDELRHSWKRLSFEVGPHEETELDD